MRRFILLLCLLAVPTRVYAQAVFIQLITGGGTTGGTSTPSNTITATTGNLLVVATVIGGGVSNPVSTITDPAGNTYSSILNTQVSNASLFGGCIIRLFFSNNITGFTGVLTANTALTISGFSNLQVVEYSNPGGWVANPLDVGKSASGNGTPSAGAMTLAQNNELIVGYGLNATGTPAWVNLTDRNGLVAERFGDYQGASSGSYTTAMAAGGGQFVIASAAFKVPAASTFRSQIGGFLVGP